MAISPKSEGLHHVALRCSDFEKTKHFYHDVLGFQVALDTDELIGFLAGGFILVFKKAQVRSGEYFTPFNIGLDHLAMACDTEEELKRVADALAEAGVENTGVKVDETLKKNYVAFKDPDRIQWEFYMK